MIFRSPFADTDVPDVTLTQYVLRAADRLADKVALVDSSTGVSLTYGELSRKIRGVAAGLAREGVGKGDVVALNSCNLPDYPVAFHAVASLGAIVTTVNPLSTATEFAQQLSDSGAKIIIAGAGLVPKTLEAAALAGLDTVFAFGDADGARPFDSLDLRDADPPDVDIDPIEDVVALPYSSGTTGLPKGVMLTHRNLVGNLRQFEALEHIAEDDTLVCVLPMYHIYGMTVIMNGGLAVGATVVTMPRFDLESFLSTICRFGVTVAHVVPPIVLALAKLANLEKYDLSRLRAVFSGAAPLGPDISRECADHIGCAVLQGYGMTELSPGTHAASSDPASVRYGSVGHLLPNTECRIVDVETGEDCDAGREGEILVRGVQVMKGYLNQPEATAATVDSDGWLHTGDIGYVDDEGYFFVVDRVKELIKFKGYQVAPAELEALLLTHPAVADAAVVPRPDPEAGEVPVAFVVLRSDVPLAELQEFVASLVAPYKKLRAIERIDKIPKSPAGKILRRLLRDRLRIETRSAG